MVIGLLVLQSGTPSLVFNTDGRKATSEPPAHGLAAGRIDRKATSEPPAYKLAAVDQKATSVPPADKLAAVVNGAWSHIQVFYAPTAEHPVRELFPMHNNCNGCQGQGKRHAPARRRRRRSEAVGFKGAEPPTSLYFRKKILSGGAKKR